MAKLFKPPATTGSKPRVKSDVVHFSSRGTRATAPLFSDLCRNFYATIDLNGNPFYSGTEPSGGVQAYDYNRIALCASDFFADGLFGAYEYYRIAKIETEFVWDSAPSDGVVSGDLYTAHDFDSREAETSNEYINRKDLRHQVFTNQRPILSDTYTPRMVDNISTDTESKDYVQPSNRWWNCENVRDHRWGCLRYIIVAHAKAARYSGTPVVFVRHRLHLEVKGQKNVVTPSIPPATVESGEAETALPSFGKQKDLVRSERPFTLRGDE